jgi:hypothetical protein
MTLTKEEYFKNEFLKKDNEINFHYFHRYMKIILFVQNKNSSVQENHHILPKSIFPEHINNKENIVSVPAKWHYILHWVVFNIFSKKKYKHKMIFAFNQMKRIVCGDKKKGVLYELSRKYVAEAVSRSNKGRERTEEIKAAVGKRTIGTVIVKDTEGNRFRVDKTNPKYISGEYVFYRTGNKHTEKTIKKMKKNSGIKGKIPCFNYKGEVKYFYSSDIPVGWVQGNPKHLGCKRSEQAKNKMKERWKTREESTCPHCGKTSKNKGNLNRYHFQNCKKRRINDTD